MVLQHYVVKGLLFARLCGSMYIRKGRSFMGVNNLRFEPWAVDKKLAMACAASTLVSVCTVFVIMKIGLSYNDEKIQSVAESNAMFGAKIATLAETIKDLNTELEAIKSEWKSSKENSSYIYTTLSSLQKDISVIKEKLNIDSELADEQTKQLSPEKKTFIDSFENLIKDGAPFDSFLETNKNKIDMTKYKSAEALVKFSTQNIKSLADLKKDYANVGATIFKTNFEESFWERQKRVIKEKISEAIKIRKFDEESSPVGDSDSDKTKFEKAGKFLSDEKYAEAIKILKLVKIEDENLDNFLVDLKKRQGLEEAFCAFKKEFIDIEANVTQSEESK